MEEKFQTLTHFGVLFPEEYKPKGYIFKGTKLSPLAEEMAWNYSMRIDTEYTKDSVFNKNFFSCFKKELTSSQIAKFPEDYMDLFEEMKNTQLYEKEEKKEYNKAHKDEIKKEKEALKEKYGFAYLDGVKQPIGAFIVEGPGILYARGNSPLRGYWKYRTFPEDVIINFIKDEKMTKAPTAPSGHNWKMIEHNKSAFVIAKWKVNVGGVIPFDKKVIFAPTSTIKLNADQKKYEKARLVNKNWSKISSYIEENMLSSDENTKQCALAAYLISVTGIRVGNEKEEVADNGTKGMTTLLCEDAFLKDGKIFFNFLGKDSVRNKSSFEISKEAYSIIEKILSSKKKDSQIFDISSGDLNSFLKNCLPYLTAKLFRTAIGTKLLCDVLRNQTVPSNISEKRKVAYYNEANLEVAKMLNHQHGVAKGFSSKIDKFDDSIEKCEEQISSKKEKAKDKLKKYEKELTLAPKLWEGKELEEKKAEIKDKILKVQDSVNKSIDRLALLKEKKSFADESKNYALGTSKTNYSSAYIAYSWAKTNNIDIGLIYNASLQKKFSWAAAVDKDYWKKYPNND